MATAQDAYRITSRRNGNVLARELHDIHGLELKLLVEDMVRQAESQDHKPEEAKSARPDSLIALTGGSFGNLYSRNEQADPLLMGSATILDRNRSDSSLAWELHDSTMAHLLGTSMEPHVAAERGKSVMAETLRALARHRWAIENFRETIKCIVADSRMHGTSGAQIFRDPASRLARTRWISSRDLILDPKCRGDLSQTRFRGVTTWMMRGDLRKKLRGWGKPDRWADSAGFRSGDVDDGPKNVGESLAREQEVIRVVDWYWDHEGYRRHVVLADGIVEPLRDVDRWPYDLPPGRWPIVALRWNELPGETWGASDHRIAELVACAATWSLRFMIDAAAEAAKVITIFDRALGTPDHIQKAIGNLRIAFQAVPLDMQSAAVSNIGIKGLLDFLNVPTAVDKVQQVFALTRETVERATGLAEMQQKVQNPTLEPPRLATRIQAVKNFVAECLVAESCADLTVLPRDALVRVRRADDQIDVLSMPLADAESLERNQVPTAIRIGLTADQFDPSLADEKALRVARRIGDEDQIAIVEPGIARYATRRSEVAAWEGGVPGVAARVLSDYSFSVHILGGLAQSEAAMQRALGALSALMPMYQEWGAMTEIYEWSARAEAAMASGQPEPPAPQMLLNILSLHQDVVRASGSQDAAAMSIRPIDLARTLAAGKRAMDEQAKAQADAEKEDPQKAQLEVAKLQIELQKLELSRQKVAAEVEVEQIQARTELLRQQHEILKKQIDEQRLALEHEREMRELPFRLAQTEARTASTIAQRDRTVANAQAEVLRAQGEETRAEIEAALVDAEARVKIADAELKGLEAERRAIENETARVTPQDTVEAKNLAEIDLIRAKTERELEAARKEKALAELAVADAVKARADARAAIRPAPPRKKE